MPKMTMTEATDDKRSLLKLNGKNQETLEEEADKKDTDDSDVGKSNMSTGEADLNKKDSNTTNQSDERDLTKDKMTVETDTQEEIKTTCAAVDKPKDDMSQTPMATESERTDLMNKKQYGVLGNIKTNDSPIQAVSQLTDVNAYTVQWRPSTTNVTSTETPRDLSTLQNSTGVVTSNEEVFSPQSNGHGIHQKPKTSQSVLELTVDKLKSSKSNGTITETSDTLPSKVRLPSSAPSHILNEIKERAQSNRRKSPFVTKNSPSPIFRGLNSRRGFSMRNKHNMPAVGQFVFNPFAVSAANSIYAMNNGGLDLSPKGNINDHSQNNGESYVINRTPLRKIAPKLQPLMISTGPTTPPMSLVQSPHALISPIGRPIGSPNSSPSLSFDASKWKTRVTSTADSSERQEKPLDLCTKGSATSSEASSAPSSPSSEIYDESQPLNLSKNKPDCSPSVDHKPHQLPPMSGHLAGMWNWKTPPRSTFLANHKPEGTSSPMEGDTASETAATSPGLDNQKLPYGLIMSPEMMNGLVPLGAISPTGQIARPGYPEGAILLPGPGPHYRLSTHMALQHNEPPTPERPYMCDQCGATFKRNKSLKQHHRVHVNDKTAHHFSDNSALQQQVQGLMKSLPCDVCPRKFAHPEQLRRHARGHREEKPFICENEHCGKRFSDSSQLKLHMRTHSSHKPFPCPYCPLRFKYSGDVKRHVRIHTGEKPYVCGYCKMRFTQSNTLKQHERTHTGERPYHCHKCGMTFTQSGSLKYHLAHRHPPDVQTVIITTSAPTLTSGSGAGNQMMIMNTQHAHMLK